MRDRQGTEDPNGFQERELAQPVTVRSGCNGETPTNSLENGLRRKGRVTVLDYCLSGFIPGTSSKGKGGGNQAGFIIKGELTLLSGSIRGDSTVPRPFRHNDYDYCSYDN